MKSEREGEERGNGGEITCREKRGRGGERERGGGEKTWMKKIREGNKRERATCGDKNMA